MDTCFNPIPKPSSLASWPQICLLNSIAVFETVRSYQLKKVATVGCVSYQMRREGEGRGHKYVGHKYVRITFDRGELRGSMVV